MCRVFILSSGWIVVLIWPDVKGFIAVPLVKLTLPSRCLSKVCFTSDASRVVGMLPPLAAAADPGLNTVVKKQATRVEVLPAARARITKDLEKLRVSPADPSANLAVGKFLCSVSPLPRHHSAEAPTALAVPN